MVEILATNTNISFVIHVSSSNNIRILDNPSSILVSNIFYDVGFTTWKTSTMIALFMKNKLGIVNGSIAERKIDSTS